VDGGLRSTYCASSGQAIGARASHSSAGKGLLGGEDRGRRLDGDDGAVAPGGLHEPLDEPASLRLDLTGDREGGEYDGGLTLLGRSV
jgi:hypothetical protein